MTDDTKEFDRDLTDFGLDADDSFDAAPFGDFEDSDSLGWDPEAEGFVLSDVGLGPWQASMMEDEVMLSPERIRFATLASIQCDGQAAKVDGVITNLSSEGLACVCAAELDPGSKVEISFQIDLSDEVLVIPAEIIWRRYADMGASEGDPSYGVRFLELTEQQGNVIDDLIRERTEGRASEWSMPALPILESAAPMTPRSRRGWVMAGTAATAGLAMALAVLLLPGAESVADADRPTVVVKAGSGATLAAASRVVEEALEAPEPSDVEPQAAPAEPKGEAEVAEVNPVAPTVLPTEIEPVHDEPSEARVVATASLPASPAEPIADIIVVDGTDDAIKLVLPTDGKVGKHKSFWLTNPQRFVVDIPGRKSELARLSYDIDHPLAQRVRVGRHPDKVRFVVDTSPEVLRKATLEADEHELVVNLRRR